MYEASGKEGLTFRLNSPITEEQWDAITDVDFEHTDRIWFSTKHGKEVEFIKRKKGAWLEYIPEHGKCPFCGNQVDLLGGKANNFCGECGADMRGKQE